MGSINQGEYFVCPGKVRNTKVMYDQILELSEHTGEGKFKISSEKRIQAEATKAGLRQQGWPALSVQASQGDRHL